MILRIKDAWPSYCKKSIRWTHFKQQVLKYLSSNKKSKNEYISNTKCFFLFWLGNAASKIIIVS